MFLPPLSHIFAAIALLASPAQAEVIRIGSDRGGTVIRYEEKIAAANARGARVQITGRICLSSCTMWLGADNVCVGADTIFGFHMPTRRGKRLKPDEHRYWAETIASYYPEHIRRWYLAGPGYSRRVGRVRGRNLGVEICKEEP